MISPRHAVRPAGGAGWQLQFGARPQGDGSTVFRVWAPLAESLAVRIVGGESSRLKRLAGRSARTI